jgi:hypothetical protein
MAGSSYHLPTWAQEGTDAPIRGHPPELDIVCRRNKQIVRCHEQIYPPAYTWDFYDDPTDAGVMGDEL